MMKIAAITLMILGLILACWFLFLGGYLTGNPMYPDPAKAKEINPFITGLVVPLLTLGSTLLIIENLRVTSLQNFNNNFFQLINQHHRLVENLTTTVDGISTPASPSTKRDVFDDLAWRIATDYEFFGKNQLYIIKNTKGRRLDPNPQLAPGIKNEEGLKRLNSIYDHYFHIHQSDLSHYFRNLYHIVKFVHTSRLPRAKKKSSLKILRAQLSNYELLLLAYDGLHTYGEKFKPLIERYELLKGLNSELRLTPNRTKRIIDYKLLMTAYPHLKKYYTRHQKKSAHQHP
jgi:hypothetical protein